MSLSVVTIDTSELSTDSWVVVQTREGRPIRINTFDLLVIDSYEGFYETQFWKL